MIDTLLANFDRLSPPSFWDELQLSQSDYIVLTMHRPTNVDEVDVFNQLVGAIGEASGSVPVIFPLHPRTRKSLEAVSTLPKNFHIVDPQAYLQFNFLVKNALAVVTDSGGITEEATIMNVPCITLRDSTERPETVEVGTNEIIGQDAQRLKTCLEKIFAGNWKDGSAPEKWDGKAGDRIVSVLETILLE